MKPKKGVVDGPVKRVTPGHFSALRCRATSVSVSSTTSAATSAGMFSPATRVHLGSPERKISGPYHSPKKSISPAKLPASSVNSPMKGSPQEVSRHFTPPDAHWSEFFEDEAKTLDNMLRARPKASPVDVYRGKTNGELMAAGMFGRGPSSCREPWQRSAHAREAQASKRNPSTPCESSVSPSRRRVSRERARDGRHPSPPSTKSQSPREANRVLQMKQENRMTKSVSFIDSKASADESPQKHKSKESPSGAAQKHKVVPKSPTSRRVMAELPPHLQELGAQETRLENAKASLLEKILTVETELGILKKKKTGNEKALGEGKARFEGIEDSTLALFSSMDLNSLLARISGGRAIEPPTGTANEITHVEHLFAAARLIGMGLGHLTTEEPREGDEA